MWVLLLSKAPISAFIAAHNCCNLIASEDAIGSSKDTETRNGWWDAEKIVIGNKLSSWMSYIWWLHESRRSIWWTTGVTVTKYDQEVELKEYK